MCMPFEISMDQWDTVGMVSDVQSGKVKAGTRPSGRPYTNKAATPGGIP